MVQQVKLHSTYNPNKEAERFCETILGSPKIIVITEPGESYLAPVLRNKFPEAKIIAIRYTDSYFLQSDNFWDSVWRPVNGNLDFFLIKNIPDELLSVSVFLSWKPAELIWKEAANFVWKTISSSIKIIQSIITTRSFFSKRWLKNMTDNFLFTENPINFEFTNRDSIFIASGGSLKTLLTNYKQFVNNKFILTVSSAIETLNSYNVSPTLCISTDGGFWAGENLKNISKKIPICFPPEAKIPYNILSNNPCMFLNYGSLIEKLFFNDFEIKAKNAIPNGTVSGTAVNLLLDNTKGNIYVAGLDLQGTKGFSHAQPHESIKSKFSTLSKVNPISQLVAVSNFDTRSLDVYAKWFLQLPSNKAKRIFRFGNEGRTIENISRIQYDEFNLHSEKNNNHSILKQTPKKSKLDKKIIIHNFYKRIEQYLESELFFEQLNIGLNNQKQKNIETELAALISFKEYIKYIKENKTENSKIAELELKNTMKEFINLQIKRLKDD